MVPAWDYMTLGLYGFLLLLSSCLEYYCFVLIASYMSSLIINCYLPVTDYELSIVTVHVITGNAPDVCNDLLLFPAKLLLIDMLSQ